MLKESLPAGADAYSAILPISSTASNRVKKQTSNPYMLECIERDRLLPQHQYYIDILLSIAGIVICLTATTVTALGVITKIASGSSC
jgi:hypothetical protein